MSCAKRRPASGSMNITSFFSRTLSEKQTECSDTESVGCSSPPSKKLRKERCTGFDFKWKSEFPWVEEVDGGMKCALCIRHQRRPKRAAVGQATWVDQPCTWIVRKAITRHEISDAHKEAKAFEANRSAPKTIQGAVEEMTGLQLQARVAAFRNLYWLIKQEIPHTSNYLPLMQLCKEQGVNILCNLHQGGNNNGQSQRFIQEAVLTMGRCLKDNLLEDVYKSPWYAIMVDETTDVAVLSEMIVYIRLFGCYECLDGGDLGEALEDFTGGVSEQLNLADIGVVDNPEEQNKFFERLKKEVDRKSLLAASIPAESSEEMEASTAMGLVKGHAYGITAVKNISLESGMFSFWNKNKIQMVRLRNPWGQGEWTGAFSDNDPEWKKIPKSEREKAGIVFEEDGEFWMTFDDFCHHYVNVSYCRVVNTSMFSLSKTWHEGIAHSAWKTPDRAGGCLNNKETFLKNPQFVFSITDDDDDCMMQLMQKSVRSQAGSGNTTIGFTIMKVEENRRYRIHDYTYQEVIKNTVFRDSRSIFQKLKLDKGRYLVVACTFDAGVQQEFLFRIYSGAANDFRELHHDKPQRSFWNCCAKQPVMVTQIKVLKAEGLEKQERDGADPYCIIKCEGEKVTTSVQNDTCNPEWKQAAIFFRKNPLKNPVKVQIWNNNILKDSYMGKHLFISADECTRSIQSVSLVGRGKQGDQIRSGKLIVEITQTKTLTSI